MYGVYREQTFKLFAEKKLSSLFQHSIRSMEAEIDSQTDNYILNVNKTDFIKYLVDKYSIDNIEFIFNEVFVSTHEKDIPAEKFPRHDFWVREGHRYKKDIIRYHIPCQILLEISLIAANSIC